MNLQLERFWAELELGPAGQVLAPRCGKSRDPAWLAGQGHRVLGVDIRNVPPRARGGPKPTQADPFQSWSAGSVDIPSGDFFALIPELPGPVEGFYDRASLVALAPPMRRSYWARLAELLAPGNRILLLSWE